MGFLTIRLLDIIDIILVGYVLFKIYTFIKGTIAIKIFVGFFSVYVIWLVVKALNMQLLSAILGQFMGIGIIALVVVFQQELRKFFLYLGSRYLNKNNKLKLENIFSSSDSLSKFSIDNLIYAIDVFSRKKTGALIVLQKSNNLQVYIESGDIINASISAPILESIFYKNSPLHDGAVIIEGNIIKAARCVLPLSEKNDLPSKYGMRHRAALGLSEINDAFVIIVSEETGNISYAENESINEISSIEELKSKLSGFIF